MRVRIFGTLSLSLLFVITLSVALVTTGLAQPSDETQVTFPDANLEAAIRDAINKPEGPIFTFDLDGLTSLNAFGITDLTGLEYDPATGRGVVLANWGPILVGKLLILQAGPPDVQ